MSRRLPCFLGIAVWWALGCAEEPPKPSPPVAIDPGVWAGSQLKLAPFVGEPAGSSSGGESRPTPVVSGPCGERLDWPLGAGLDPERAYLFGTLPAATTSCPRWVVATLDGCRYTTGFSCDADRPAVVDEQLVFKSAGARSFWWFNADEADRVEPWNGEYPSEPLDNDAAVATDRCVAERVEGGPGGVAAYRCRDAWWYGLDDDAPLVRDGPGGELLKLGGGVALLGFPSQPRVSIIEFETQEQVHFELSSPPVASRSTAHGFWVVTADASTLELWLLTPAGVATRKGTYPPMPKLARGRGQAVLEGSGALVHESRGIGDEALIVRRRLEGGSEVVYRASEAWVELDSGRIISGNG